MNKVKINGLLAVYISYLQCLQINFEDLNCHSCKSKEKLKHRRNKGNHGNDSVSNNFDTVNLDHNKTLNNDCCKCNCGKKSKGLCGLKVHQRSCRAITSLSSSNFVIDNIKQDATENCFVTTNSKQDEFPFLKEDVKLPKSLEDWYSANMYFHSELSTINIKNNLNEAMRVMNSTICNFFCDNYGHRNSIL